MVDETADWQRCLTMGLVSQKAASTVVQAYMDVTNQRYQYIASRIDETLKEDESAILVISDNHRVQFSGDIQVFYIAPPALNDIRRWINDRMVEVDRSGDDGEQGGGARTWGGTRIRRRRAASAMNSTRLSGDRVRLCRDRWKELESSSSAR